MENQNERFWVSFFSKTGTEIVEISEGIGKYPDKIITNLNEYSSKINPRLLTAVSNGWTELVTITNPSIDNYRKLIPLGSLVTLHGYMKIVPPEICDEYEIVNSHPGLISKYPELKGKDPQKKAYDLGLETTGCTIHEATAEVDSGKILSEVELSILPQETLDGLIALLHKASVILWCKYLEEKLFTPVPEFIENTI